MLILEYISISLFYHILVEFCISKIFQLEELKMKNLITFYILISLSVGLFSGCAYYQEGYDDGYNHGYTDGGNDGYEYAYEDGEDEGYDVGYSDGYSDGYDEGYECGYDEAYQECISELAEYDGSLCFDWI